MSPTTTTSNIRSRNIRCITLTDNIPEHWPELISIAKSSYPFYAYIYHDKDIYETENDLDCPDCQKVGQLKPKHIHLVCYEPKGTTFKAHCERFSSVLPSNFIEKAKSPRAVFRYLTHQDFPNKYQYDFREVITNNLDKLSYYLKDTSADSVDMFEDFMKVKRSEINVKEFLEKYRNEVANLNFYQKVALYDKLIRLF